MSITDALEELLAGVAAACSTTLEIRLVGLGVW